MVVEIETRSGVLSFASSETTLPGQDWETDSSMTCQTNLTHSRKVYAKDCFVDDDID